MTAFCDTCTLTTAGEQEAFTWACAWHDALHSASALGGRTYPSHFAACQGPWQRAWHGARVGPGGARLVGRRELLGRRAKIDGHMLAGVGRFGFDLHRDGAEIFCRLHEGSDLGVHLRVGRVLRAKRVRVASELRAGCL